MENHQKFLWNVEECCRCRVNVDDCKRHHRRQPWGIIPLQTGLCNITALHGRADGHADRDTPVVGRSCTGIGRDLAWAAGEYQPIKWEEKPQLWLQVRRSRVAMTTAGGETSVTATVEDIGYCDREGSWLGDARIPQHGQGCLSGTTISFTTNNITNKDADGGRHVAHGNRTFPWTPSTGEVECRW